VIVVDSSVWISHFADVLHPEVVALRTISRPSQILMGELVLVDILQGAASEEDARYFESELSLFTAATMLDRSTTIKAAENYRRLRERGITVRKTVDLIIGTYCIEHGHQLLHRDRDFDKMQQLGLQIYTPA
jgi:predicted nucleic acid-binding protein